jgi:hypothetical protein
MQSVEHLTGRASPPKYDPFVNTEHQEADHDLSKSVSQERVDSHTLKALEHLLGVKGLQFLAAFLRQAEAKQLALAGLGVVDCAVITTKTIRALAKHIGWGYDTTEKYLVVLCALHFLHKEKSTDDIAYFFPLHRYTPLPATLDALEGVIGNYRPKVQSFARKTKRRFLVYLEQQQSPVLSLPTPESLPFDLAGAEEAIEQIMQEELGAGLLPQRLLGKIKGVLRYRCQATGEHISTQTGDSDDLSTPEKSPISFPKGDFSSAPLKQESPLSKKGDSAGVAAPQNRRLSEQKGDSSSRSSGSSSSEKSPVLPPKGDSPMTTSPSNGRLSPQKGDFSPKTGDSKQEESPNVNVILHTLIDSFLNDNDKSKVIEHLRTIFNEPPAKRGYYHNLYKSYKQPEAWLAAAIETLIAYHKKGTDQPGKYFYDLCVTFHTTIPQDTLDRARQYGQLTHEQLLATLASAPAPTVTNSRPTRLSQSQQPQIVPRFPREKDRNGLTAQEVQQVIALVRSDERMCTVGIARYRQTDGSSALLIDNGKAKYPRQVWIYAVKECQARLARMKIQNEFFQEGEVR